jgi:hypothetical protein
MSNRAKLSDEFVDALHESWKVHGDSVLLELRKIDPKAYARLVADLTPKQSEVAVHNVDKFAGLSSDELREMLIEKMAGAIEQQIAADLPRFQRLVREARRAQRRGEIPPDGYAQLDSRDRWLVDHGRKPKEEV